MYSISPSLDSPPLSPRPQRSNPSFQKLIICSNLDLIGPAESLLLIDTAQGEESFDLLLKQVLKEISAHGGKAIIKNIILTHYHEDHINGLPQVLNLVKEFGFGGESGKPVVWKYPCEDLEKESVLNELIGVDGWQRLENGMKFEVGEGRLEVIHTPGHTQDSISLLLTGKDEIPSLFTADTVLGHGTAVFENLSAYIDSLELCIKKLESFLGEGNKFILYPGHGEIVEGQYRSGIDSRADEVLITPFVDGIEMMKGYIKHRLDREAQVLEALSTANAETSTAEE